MHFKRFDRQITALNRKTSKLWRDEALHSASGMVTVMRGSLPTARVV
jgi:hypothetical protein